MDTLSRPDDTQDDQHYDRLSDQLNPGQKAEQDQVDTDRGFSRLNDHEKSSIADMESDFKDPAVDKNSSLAGDKGSGAAGGAASNLAGNAANQAAGWAVSALSSGGNPVSGTVGKVVNKVLSFASRNKRQTLVGSGVGVAITVLILFGGGEILSVEIKDIEKTLLNDVSKIVKHVLNKGEGKVDDTLAKKAKERATKAGAEEEATEEKEGGELTKDIDSFNFADPEVIKDLNAQGIKVKLDADGNFAGLEDEETGKDVTNDILSDPDVAAKLGDAFDGEEAEQDTDFDQLQVDQADVSLAGIPPDVTDQDKVKEDIVDSVTEGSSDASLVSGNAGEESSGQQPTKDSPPGSTGDSGTLNSEGGALGEALAAAEKAAAAGGVAPGTGETAVEAGVDAANLGNPILVASLATTACSLEKDVSEAAKARVILITTLLIRHAAFIFSFAGEVSDPNVHLPSATMNTVMNSVFNGSTTDVVKAGNGEVPEGALPFTSSAAWQQMNGLAPVSDVKSHSFTPDISKSALPTANSGTKIVDEINGAMKGTGANLACSALTSPFGFVVQGIAGLGQLIGDIGSFGLGQVAATAAIIAAQEVIKHVILPDIIKYFLPLGEDGSEDKVQWMNNSRAGGSAAFSDYARSFGSQPLPNDQANKLSNAGGGDLLADQERLPWTTRTFSPNNPYSLTSKLAVEIPTNGPEIVANISSFFTTLPSTLMHDLGTIVLLPKVSALDQPVAACVYYNITCYGIPDAQNEKYDMVKNDIYLQSTVSYGGVTAKRIDMAGDPYKFDDTLVDSSTIDLMHCFLDSYSQDFSGGDSPAADMTTGANDPICASMGSLDYVSDTPQPMTDANVAVSYCDYLTGSSSDPPQACISAVTPQLHDDIGHFSQLIFDHHIMNGIDKHENFDQKTAAATSATGTN